MQSVQSQDAQYNIWMNAINDCTLCIEDEELIQCEYSNKNGTSTLNKRATVCFIICNSVSVSDLIVKAHSENKRRPQFIG